MPRELRTIVRRLGMRPAPASAGRAWARPASGRTTAHDGLAAAAVGVGPSAAREGARRALDRLAPAEVLVVGLAGGIDERVGVADLVVPRGVVDMATGTRYTPLAVPGGRAEAVRRAALGETPEGALVTVASLGAPLPDPLPPDALALDMETAAIAAACEAHGVPWAVVRAVSDTPGTVTPAIRTLVGDDGALRVGAVVRLVTSRPSSVTRLARLGLGARRAQRRLDEVVLVGLSPDASGHPGAGRRHRAGGGRGHGRSAPPGPTRA